MQLDKNCTTPYLQAFPATTRKKSYNSAIKSSKLALLGNPIFLRNL